MHANARLTPIGRLTLCLRIEGGRPVAHVAPEMGISRATGYKWWNRFCDEGVEGLVDRSSRPYHCPHRTMPAVEAQIAELRAELKLGPARIGYRLGVAPSTVHRVLVRLGLNRLSWMDRPSGRVIRRYERDRPGELVHVDIKSSARSPTEAGGRPLDDRPARGTVRASGARGLVGPATASFTPPSTTTAGWRTQRSSPTSAKTPPPGSGPGPRVGFLRMASRSKRY